MPTIDEIAAQYAGGRTLEELRDMMGSHGYIMEPDPEAAARLRAYWEHVFADRPEKPEQMVCRSTSQEMQYEEARRKFWAILQFRATAIETIENEPFHWTFSPEDQANIQNLLRYFINDPACAWPLTKGLFICGVSGTGKTEIMTALGKFTEQNSLTKAFQVVSMSAEFTRAKADKDYDPIAPNIQFDKCFDEFGRYTGPIKRFGDELDINEAIVEERYNRNRKYGQLTHFVTNVTPNEVEGMFSPMIYDRLRAMCTSVVFTGESKRK